MFSNYVVIGMYNITEVNAANKTIFDYIKSSLSNISEISCINLNYLNECCCINDLGAKRKLLLGHTCGWPLTYNPRSFKVVSIPKYSFDGCNGYFIKSIIIVKKSSTIFDISDIFGKKLVAINSRSSCTGCLLLAAKLQKDIMDEVSIIYTGSHEKSIEAIINDHADVAAIDCVTFGLLQLHRPSFLHDIRIVDTTDEAPGLPFVTSFATSQDDIIILQNILKNMVASTDVDVTNALKTLGIIGFEFESATFSEFENAITRLQAKANISNNFSACPTDNLLVLLQNDEVFRKQHIASFREKDKTYANFLFSVLKFFLAQFTVSKNTESAKTFFDFEDTFWTSSKDEAIRLVLPRGAFETKKSFDSMFEEYYDDAVNINENNNNNNYSNNKINQKNTRIATLSMVEFIGERIAVQNCTFFDHKIVDMCWLYDEKILSSFDPDVIVAYISGEFGNLIIFNPSTAAVSSSPSLPTIGVSSVSINTPLNTPTTPSVSFVNNVINVKNLLPFEKENQQEKCNNISVNDQFFIEKENITTEEINFTVEKNLAPKNKKYGKNVNDHIYANSVIAPHFYSTVRIHRLHYDLSCSVFNINSTLYIKYFDVAQNSGVWSTVECPAFFNETNNCNAENFVEKKRAALRYRIDW
jgi:hypothetical protein